MRITAAQGLAAALIAIGLAGCGQSDRGGDLTAAGATGLCTPFKTEDAAARPANPGAANATSAAVDECLHRWGYALAAARENADVVAGATVTACGSAIANWNQQGLAQAGQQPTDAQSLTTGQPTDLLGEHAQYAQSQALFYVVQARAGKCAAPPGRLLVRGG
jgi:hypothetical protein